MEQVNLTDPAAWMTLDEVLALVPVNRCMFDRWIVDGKFPEGYRHGKGRRWFKPEVESWLLSGKGVGNSQMDAAHAARVKARESASEAP